MQRSKSDRTRRQRPSNMDFPEQGKIPTTTTTGLADPVPPLRPPRLPLQGHPLPLRQPQRPLLPPMVPAEDNCGETADSRFYHENDEKGFYGYEETNLFGFDMSKPLLLFLTLFLPCELACYSCAEDGDVYFDDRSSRLFKRHISGYFGVDLNEGFDTFIEKKNWTLKVSVTFWLA